MCGDLNNRSKYITIRCILFLTLLFAFTSCSNTSEKSITGRRPGKSEMTDLNRYLVQKDRERIQNYIERKNLRMTESPTGLWYQILREGSGKNYSDNDKIIFNYECSLLDGTKCYSSDKLGPKELILGKSIMEPGMNEGLRLLNPGSEAIFIMPSYLAYGLIGDGKMIPSRAVIVYNVNILQPE
jgi:FKBP-type peptidyl-prolyl cis-trans isomerase FkpA